MNTGVVNGSSKGSIVVDENPPPVKVEVPPP
jgi:hypothetical protein